MLNVSDITIDMEFEGLIPALSDDERTQLMVNIQRDGFRDPLVVWLGHGILLDGHHRYRIWEASFQGDENREPSIVETKFATREKAKAWVIQNQLGRRNLTDAQRVALALKLKPMLVTKAKANQSAGGQSAKVGRQKSDKPLRVNKEVAKIAGGVSHDTVRKVETVLAKGDDAIKSAMLNGKMKINAAHKTVKSERVELIIGRERIKLNGIAPANKKSRRPSGVSSAADAEHLRADFGEDVQRLLDRAKRTRVAAIQQLSDLADQLQQVADENVCRGDTFTVYLKSDFSSFAEQCIGLKEEMSDKKTSFEQVEAAR